MIKQTLFSTDIYKVKVKQQEELKSFFISNIESEYNVKGPNCDFCNVYSDYFPGARTVDWEDILPKYQSTIQEFLNEYGYKDSHNWKVGIDAWYNVTGKGGWGETHNHLSSPRTIQISAVHYMKYDPKHHSPTIFYNPSSDGIRSSAPTPITNNLPTMWPKEVVNADALEGDMIFFAPYLNHSIPVQKSDVPRITIAFNITITEN